MKNVADQPAGFATIAAYIALDPDNSTKIYRKFDFLAIRNLLYLQCKLQNLEAAQIELDKEIFQGHNHEDIGGATSWVDFQRLATTDPKWAKRKALAEDIQNTLRDYYQALNLQNGIAHMERPLPTSLRAYKKFFTYNDPNTWLRGHDSRILDEEEDLVAIRTSLRRDRLTRFIMTYIPWIFGVDIQEAEFQFVSENRLAKIVTIISTLLAAALLIGAIVALNFTNSQNMRIGLVSAFTVAFAGSVALTSNAGKNEVFAATAAYAAVLLIFISGNPVSLS